MPTILNPDQVHKILEIISKRHAAVILRILGPDALTTDERNSLLSAGIPLEQHDEVIRQAYLYGQLQAKLEQNSLKTLSLDAFEKRVAKNPIELSNAEEFAVKAAELNAGAHIRHLGAKIQQQASMLVFKEDATARAAILREVKTETSENIQKRESIGKLKKELSHLQPDWNRDWNRVAITEKTNAMNRGNADGIRAAHGDAWVFKRPMPDACKHCVKLHIGPDGHPRIFKLTALEANGTNVGRKAADWMPVVGTTHPHCQCALSRVPPGWGFDDNDDLVPGGKGGIRYETMETMEKAAELEDLLQKSFKVQERIDFHGLPIAIEQRAGELRPWKDSEGNEGETRLIFAYGYIEGTRAADDAEVDCFVGPDPSAPFVFIIHQNKRDEHKRQATHREYDEEKCMLGFPDAFTAKQAYEVHYDRPDLYFGAISQIQFEEFKEKVLATKTKGSMQADGMVKAMTSDSAAGESQMGNRAVSPTAGGVNFIVGSPPNHAGAMTRPETIKKLKEHLSAYTDFDRERYMLQIPNGAEVYNWHRTPPENVYPYHHSEMREEMDAQARAEIPNNRLFLDNEIAKRLALVAPNVVIDPDLPVKRDKVQKLRKAAPPQYTEQAGHLYISKQWDKDHWVYAYAKLHEGKVVEHDYNPDMVVLKLPKHKFELLQKFAKDRGLKFYPMMGSKYALLPMTKEEAAGLKAEATAKPVQLPLPVQEQDKPKPKKVVHLEVLKASGLKQVPAPAPHILQSGQSVTAMIKGEQVQGVVVGSDGSDHAVIRDASGQRRLAPWKAVHKNGEKIPQVNSYDKLPPGSIRKATPEQAKFVDDALAETMVEHGKPTRAYLDWLHAKGIEAYVVGGFTRDLLAGTAAGEPPEKIKAKLKDHDIVASATVSTGKVMFDSLGHGKLGGWHTAGIIAAYGPGKTDGVDFASMSQDGYFNFDPAFHPDVGVPTPTLTWDQDMVADARRRDFSVNAVYYDVRNQAFLDPTGKGVEDSQNKFLRVIAGKEELKKNNNIALRFWKFRIRGFTSDSANTATMLKSFEDHAQKFWKTEEKKDKFAKEIAKAAGKGVKDPRPFLKKLKAIMSEDGAGHLYDTYIDPLESAIIAKAKMVNG